MSKTFLAIGAHCDDCEIGVGGLLIQAAKAGHRVVIVSVVTDLSTWAATKGREEQTKRGLADLAKKYGFEKRFLDYPYHIINSSDVELKRKLAKIQLELNPDVSFIHHMEDHFSDHTACGSAAHDALLFSHGLSGDLKSPRCPSIFSYCITPWQTYRFEPDQYVDVADVMPDYMELLNGFDNIYIGMAAPTDEFKMGDSQTSFRLGAHSLTKFADCIQHGSRAGCKYAIGLKSIWQQKSSLRLW
jgi:N-acetylglucosamine malate deacetylase 1